MITSKIKETFEAPPAILKPGHLYKFDYNCGHRLDNADEPRYVIGMIVPWNGEDLFVPLHVVGTNDTIGTGGWTCSHSESYTEFFGTIEVTNSIPR